MGRSAYTACRRMGCAKRSGSSDANTWAAISVSAAACASATSISASTAAVPRSASTSSTATARARASACDCMVARRPSTAWPIDLGPSARTRAATWSSGSRASSPSARRSSSSRKGFPPVTSSEARRKAARGSSRAGARSGRGPRPPRAPESSRHGAPRESAQRLQQCQRCARLGRPHADHEQDGQFGAAAAEVGEELQTRRICPVRVVDDYHRRPAFYEVRREPVQAVLRSERPIAPPAATSSAAVRPSTGRASEAAPRISDRQTARAIDEGFEELAHDAPREAALEFPARCCEDGAPRCRGFASTVGEERRLADAGLALHDRPAGHDCRGRRRAPRAAALVPPRGRRDPLSQPSHTRACHCVACRERARLRRTGVRGMGRVGIEPTTLGLRVPCSTS